MEIKEKLELNKLIKKYEGDNPFLLSLKKQLKTSKYLEVIEHEGKNVKVLSEKQYEAAKVNF